MPRWKMNGAGLAAWALLALSLLLAGCTVPEWQKPGTPRSEIERSMGRPTLSLPLDGGGTRLVYSRQPGPTVSWKMAFAARPMCT
jgi:nitrous oxide reductase accessory protein NosL